MPLKIIALAACVSFLVIFAAFFSGPQSLAAGALSNDLRLVNYLESTPVARRLYVAAISTNAYLNYYCGKGKINIRLLGTIDTPSGPAVKWNGLRPISGIWIVRYQVSHCEKVDIYNALFVARDNSPLFSISYPGTTKAGLVLARDLQLPLLSSAAFHTESPKNCKDWRVIGTKFEGPGGEPPFKEPTPHDIWTETWTVSVCGRAIDLQVVFYRRGEMPGVAFSVKTPESEQKWQERKQFIVRNDLNRSSSNAYRSAQATGNYVDAASTLKRLANVNSPLAQFLLALLYVKGKGVPESASGVAYWALRAAYNGEPQAMLLVGELFELGIFFDKHYETAAHWYRSASQKGETLGTEKLDALYSKGLLKQKKGGNIGGPQKETPRKPDDVGDAMPGREER